jgi:DNA-binding IclR family transcriptional regulator
LRRGEDVSRPALAATRAIEIINFLAAHPTESFTLSDLVDRLGVNVASLHAVLAVLTEAGFLSRHPRHRTYTLGSALVAVGTVATEQHGYINTAREEAGRLSTELDLDVAITARAGNEVVFVARSGAHRPRGVPTHVGLRMPIRPPIGSIFFAWADPATVHGWLKLGDAASEDDIRLDYQELGAVRQRGYSVALEGDLRRELGTLLEELAERPRHDRRRSIDLLVASQARRTTHLIQIDRSAAYAVSSLAAPVFDGNGQVTLALNLIGFPETIPGSEVMRYGSAALEAGLVVSKRTRGNPPHELLAQVPLGPPAQT